MCPSDCIIHVLWDWMSHYRRSCWYSPSWFLTELLWPEGFIDLSHIHCEHTDLVATWAGSACPLPEPKPFPSKLALFRNALCALPSAWLPLATAAFPWVLCGTILYTSPILVTASLCYLEQRIQCMEDSKQCSFMSENAWLWDIKRWNPLSTLKWVMLWQRNKQSDFAYCLQHLFPISQ